MVSYFTAKPSRDLMIAGHQQATHELWSKLFTEYETYISALVYEESRRGDPDPAGKRLSAIAAFPLLEIDKQARQLAEKIIAGRGIPSKYPEDALHVAVAAVNAIEVFITWNFRHLNNPFTRLMIRRIVEQEGHLCPEICSPLELLEADQ